MHNGSEKYVSFSFFIMKNVSLIFLSFYHEKCKSQDSQIQVKSNLRFWLYPSWFSHVWWLKLISTRLMTESNGTGIFGGNPWIHLVMQCVSTVSLNVVINGEKIVKTLSFTWPETRRSSFPVLFSFRSRSFVGNDC